MDYAQGLADDGQVRSAEQGMIMVRQKNPCTAKEASLVKRVQYFSSKAGKCLRCVENVAMFVAGGCDQVFASHTAKMRSCMERQAARLALP